MKEKYFKLIAKNDGKALEKIPCEGLAYTIFKDAREGKWHWYKDAPKGQDIYHCYIVSERYKVFPSRDSSGNIVLTEATTGLNIIGGKANFLRLCSTYADMLDKYTTDDEIIPYTLDRLGECIKILSEDLA